MSMKVAALIVALGLALASGAPAQTAPLAGAAGAVSSVAQRATTVTNSTLGTTSADNDDAVAFATPGPSTYLLLALGMLGMGLVSRRRRAD
jgi:hypothetical protein